MFDALNPYQVSKVKEVNNSTLNIKPVVSVIVLAYNHYEYLSQCLNSILSQKTNFEYEILLGEDSSTDKTKEICLHYAKLYPKIIRLFLHSKENKIMVEGKATGRFNYLFSLCNSKGKYIAICEGDDYWTDDLKLNKQVEFLENNSNYSFCWTRFVVLNQKTNEKQEDLNGNHFKNEIKFIDFNFDKFFKGWHIGNATLLYRKSFFDINTHKKFKYFKDVHLIAQLLKKGKGACLNFFGAVYRIHDEGIHSSVTEFNGYRIGYLTHREIYRDNPSNVFLKLKYLRSYANFLNANIKKGNLLSAFCMSFDLFFKNLKFVEFLRHIKRISVKLIKSQ